MPTGTTSFLQERLLDALEPTNVSLTAQELKEGDQAFSVTYTFPAKDYGAGDWTEDIQGVAGFRGRVVAFSLWDCTEIFSTTTLQARIEVGIQGGDVDAYADSADFGAYATLVGLSPAVTLGAVSLIPVGENILVTGYAPTGGTPTGIATTGVTIVYFI